ncbi:unnamed protein product [Linum trigynum]|uniref:Uncharacterized protein n=1 Tax=Linum trigynum TaxID=586398 RepID=A0AAV2CE53_9ROSI
MFGAKQGGHHAYGGLITRLVRHFQVDLERCSIVGRTESFPLSTLYNQKLVLQGERGVEYLEGLRPSEVMRPVVDPAPQEQDAEVPPPEQPARAPGRRRRPTLERSVPPPTPLPPASDPLVQRMDHLETYIVGVTSRINRQTDPLEQMARRRGLILDDELGPSTQ